MVLLLVDVLFPVAFADVFAGVFAGLRDPSFFLDGFPWSVLYGFHPGGRAEEGGRGEITNWDWK